MAHDPDTLSAATNWIVSIVAACGAVVAGIVAYFRESRKPKVGEELVLASAAFSDRATIERLAEAMKDLQQTIDRLNQHMEAQEMRAAVAAEFDKRGIAR